jgi:hypothetical protein
MVHTNLALQHAIERFCVSRFNDQDFLSQAFSRIYQMKKEFGNGYALMNIGEFKPNLGEFIFPEKEGVGLMWLDSQTTKEYLSSEIASSVLSNIDFDNCPPDHEIFVVLASVDNGASIKEGRYAVLAQSAYIKDPLLIKPSAITEKQIEKRLRRTHSAKIPLLILDTSNPDCMGKNLAKWLRVLKRLADCNDKHFNVMIDSSPEFPAQIPDELKNDCISIKCKN